MNEGKPTCFWIVFGPDIYKYGGTKKFGSFSDAEKEANRFAELNPGAYYYVLRSTHSFCTKKPEVEMRLLISDTDTADTVY